MKPQLTAINSQRTYQLDTCYESVKKQALQVLKEYLDYPVLIAFDDASQSVTFSTEKLITVFTGRPRVMLLFSNPHPYSVLQGMFLSPNTRGRKSLFWTTMEDAGWIKISESYPTPNHLADICLNAQYQGPYDLIFHCYYSFPTDYPEDIQRIFGKEYFERVIETEAKEEFKTTIQETAVDAVVVFNKDIYNLVSQSPVDRYIDHLNKCGVVQSRIQVAERKVESFLTYPTGWRYHKQFRELRRDSLTRIQEAIAQNSA